jgi:hypothetical protein
MNQCFAQLQVRLAQSRAATAGLGTREVTSASGAACLVANAANPLRIVFGDIPVVSLTSLTPPQLYKACVSVTAHCRRTRSSNTDASDRTSTRSALSRLQSASRLKRILQTL